MLCATVTFCDVVGRQLFARAVRTSSAAVGVWWLGVRIDVSGVGIQHIRDVLRQVGNAPYVTQTPAFPQSESERARERESERARARGAAAAPAAARLSEDGARPSLEQNCLSMCSQRCQNVGGAGPTGHPELI